MLPTFTALAVTALALVPGALYTWGFEREAGAWGIRAADRVFRFIGISIAFHLVAFLPITYFLWDEFVRTGRLSEGDVPLSAWPVVAAYVIVPLLLGTVVGRATVRERPWATVLTGRDPAPRAWDYLFGHRPRGWVRLRLKTGVWIGGAYGVRPDGRRSYVSGYPEPQEIFLAAAVEVDATTGRFLKHPDGGVRLKSSSILIGWEEVEYLEFIEV